jgi:RNA polymerase sigma-70 factor, ECF subfamily
MAINGRFYAFGPDGWRFATGTAASSENPALRAFRKIDTFEYRGEGALQSYLRQVLVNRIREELRKTERRPQGTTLDEGYEDPAPSPLEAAIGQQALDRYEQALECLRPADREAIIARVEMGLSYEELAAALGKPTAEAARKAAQRALIRLAEEMDRG